MSPEAQVETKQHARVLGITLGALALCLYLGTGAVMNGFIFGIIIFTTIWCLIEKMQKVKEVVVAHPKVSDVIATILGFVLLGGQTVTAWVGAGVVGALFTITISLNRLTGVQSKMRKLLGRFLTWASGLLKSLLETGKEEKK